MAMGLECSTMTKSRISVKSMVAGEDSTGLTVQAPFCVTVDCPVANWQRL